MHILEKMSMIHVEITSWNRAKTLRIEILSEKIRDRFSEESGMHNLSFLTQFSKHFIKTVH